MAVVWGRLATAAAADAEGVCEEPISGQSARIRYRVVRHVQKQIPQHLVHQNTTINTSTTTNNAANSDASLTSPSLLFDILVNGGGSMAGNG